MFCVVSSQVYHDNLLRCWENPHISKTMIRKRGRCCFDGVLSQSRLVPCYLTVVVWPWLDASAISTKAIGRLHSSAGQGENIKQKKDGHGDCSQCFFLWGSLAPVSTCCCCERCLEYFFFPLLSMLSQKCCHHCWWAWPCLVPGPSLSWLALTQLEIEETCHRRHPCKSLFHPNPCHTSQSHILVPGLSVFFAAVRPEEV